MDFVCSGVIAQVLQPQSGVSQRTGQPWQSQEFVLTYEQGQYPKSLCFRVFGADKLQQFAIRQGEQLTVHLNIECRQGQKGFFNDISCWKVDRQVQQAVQQQQQFAPAPQYQQQVAAPFPPQQPQLQPQQSGLPFPPPVQ